MEQSRIRWNGWAAGPNCLPAGEELWRWLAAELGMPALLATQARPLEDIALPPARLAPELLGQFQNSLGHDQVRNDDRERAFHVAGRSYADLLRLRAGDVAAAPDAVLYPRDEDEVRAVLIFAAAHNIAVTVFGGASASGAGGAICLDLSRMDRVVAVDAQARTATFGAGISGPILEKALGNFTLGHFPSSFEFSTLGGWIAAGDQAADWLVHARMATAHGVLEDAPEMNGLIIGSRGALGIITQAQVRIRPRRAGGDRAFLFRDFDGGIAALRAASRMEIPLDLVNFSDGAKTSFERRLGRLGKSPGLATRLRDAWTALRHYDDKAALLVAGFENMRDLRAFAGLAKKHGGMDFGEARGQRQKSFQMPYRRDAFMDRGLGMETFAVSVSWEKLADFQTALRQVLDKAMRENAPRPGAHGLVMTEVTGARRDGVQLAFTILFARLLEDEIGQWQAIANAAAQTARGHDARLGAEKEGLALDIFQALKKTLDPENILPAITGD